MAKRPSLPPAVAAARSKKLVKTGGQFFRQWRKYRKMTLEEAAPAAGMTVGNLSAMERGEQGFSEKGLYALADVYQTSPGWLLEVNPSSDEFQNIMVLWNHANATQRSLIIDIAKRITKTGTGS